MVYYLPVFAAMAIGVGTLLERIVLKRKKIDTKAYQVAHFIAIVLVMIPLLWFFWKLESDALSLINLFILFLVVIFSLIANVFLFYSLKWEKITNIEPARILEPLFVILLALVFSFFAENLYERNVNVFVPALIAGIALIFSHVKKQHLDFNKYFVAAILSSLFFALELVTSRLILDYYSPMTFYFFRSSLILLLSFIIFRPKLKGMNVKVKWYILITGAVWVIYRVIVYYGYLKIGVIFTSLIVMLGPVFAYSLAKIFLKEKLSWKNILAAIVIILAVLYAILA